MRTRRAATGCLLLALLVARVASAQTAAPSADLERAKNLFRQGNELRKAGDCGRALALYRQSRRIVPSVANTTNSAVCMVELGLDDEALEMYEDLLLHFRAELTEDETRALGTAMTSLRRKVGHVDVSSTVQGLVVIDGRARGELPLVAPIPVLPGAHVLRVIKEGYDTFEQRVSVAAGATVDVDAKLAALAHAGRLRVEVGAGDEGADVLVDGAVVGSATWEGALTTGPHLLSVRKGTRGTAPVRADVVENQTATVRASLADLGLELRVIPGPLSARISIDGVAVGTGEWRGALPLGAHAFEAREDGYLAKQTTIEVTPAPVDPVFLQLEVDATNPRWAAPRTAKLWAEARAAFAIGPGLGSGAEASCDELSCSDRTPARGGMFGARLGYELPSRLSLYIDGGYLALRTTLSRSVASSFASASAGGATSAVPLTYAIHDTVDFSGPFAGAGIGYVAPLGGGRFELAARAEAGIVLAGARDTLHGTVSGGGRTLDLAIEGTGTSVHGAAAFVLPEAAARIRLGRLYAGLGAAVGLFFVRGPSLETGSAAPKGFDCSAHPAAADCAPASNLVRAERAFGPAILVLPSILVGAEL